MKKKYANEFITVRGTQLLCVQLISAISASEWKYSLISPAAQQYRLACRAVADHIYDYMKGWTQLDTSPDYFRRYGMSYPSTKTYPDAIVEMIENLGKDFHADVNGIIFLAADSTETVMKEREKERIKKEKRMSIVDGILGKNNFILMNDAEKITAILRIQRGKAEVSAAYVYSAAELTREERAAQLWCEMLVSGQLRDHLPFHILKSLVEEEILEEDDVSKLLKEYGEERDWEWYSEDFLGCSLLDKTVINTDRILELLEPVFMDILNIIKKE